MISNIFNTFFTRFFTMAIMFALVVLNAHIFKSEGVGTIGLVIMDLTIIQLLTHLVGGSALVYLISRHNFFQILFFSYLWMLISIFLGIFVLFALQMIPDGYTLQLLLLSFCCSLYFISATVLQARERIKTFNLFAILQVVILALGVLLGVFYYKIKGSSLPLNYYFYALAFSYFALFLASLSHLKVKNVDINFFGAKKLLKEMFSFGIFIQLANLAQLLNYRMSLFFIEWFIGRKAVGIFDVGNKVSEAIWVVPKSICLVQYARLANNKDVVYAQKLSLTLFKISALFAIFAVAILCCIPASWFGFIFGQEFREIKTVIYGLAPGIVFLSGLSILAHHFSGEGKYWVNTIASVLGLFVLLILGLVFIPIALQTSKLYAIQTTALITSASYFTSFFFTLIMFVKTTKTSFLSFFINKSEIITIKNELTKWFNNNS